MLNIFSLRRNVVGSSHLSPYPVSLLPRARSPMNFLLRNHSLPNQLPQPANRKQQNITLQYAQQAQQKCRPDQPVSSQVGGQTKQQNSQPKHERLTQRSEERRVGKESVRTCRSRG